MLTIKGCQKKERDMRAIWVYILELMSARKRAPSVKHDGGFCALLAHKNHHHVLREQAPQAQVSAKRLLSGPDTN
jgi:hypothetical protein